MSYDQDTHVDDAKRHGTTLGDGVACNGVDSAAIRRAHIRTINAARQAAEKRHARPAGQASHDRPARLAAAQERAVELRTELERIDVEHWTWLQAQGEDVSELRARTRKPSGAQTKP